MKAKRLRISADMFQQLFGEGIHHPYAITDGAFPADGKIRDVRFDGYTDGGVVEVLIESESFPEVLHGSMIPELMTMITRT